jgi:nicotinate-nucleotide adenylyltransferase
LKAIGLLGGTFDPVHCGHLRLAIEVREALAPVIDRSRRAPNLRDTPQGSAEHRLAMLRLAVADGDLQVDPRELAGTGTSYTIDTMAALREERPDDSLCFMLGQDAFNGLSRWHRWEQLLDYAHLIVAARPGYVAPEELALRNMLARAQATSPTSLRNERAGRIFLQTIPLLPISATDLRNRIRGGRSIEHLTPPAVVEYIDRHRLYQP